MGSISSLADLPSYRPPPAIQGQLELVLDGVFGDDRSMSVEVPAAIGVSATAAGGLILDDDEGTPLAQLTVTDAQAVEAASGTAVAADATAVGSVITGLVARLREARTGPFRSLRRTPAQVARELNAGRALAVATGRPLLRDEEAALTAAAETAKARVIVLPCLLRIVGPPPDVLVRAIQATLPRLATSAGPAIVVPIPVAHEDSLQPPRGVLEFIAAADAAPYASGQLDLAAPWRAVITALDAPGDPGEPPGGASGLDELVAADVASVLRGWRPPRKDRGVTILFTGLSGSGKSTIARGVVDALLERGRTVTSVDGDVARRMLSAGLSFSRADRDLNILRIGWIASEVTRHGGVAVCAPIAPYAATRAAVRDMVEANGDFVLVHISTPLEVCERRDRKGLYAKARAGEIENFTGISDPYEAPDDADLTIDTSAISVDDAIGHVISHLTNGGWLPTSP